MGGRIWRPRITGVGQHCISPQRMATLRLRHSCGTVARRRDFYRRWLEKDEDRDEDEAKVQSMKTSGIHISFLLLSNSVPYLPITTECDNRIINMSYYIVDCHWRTFHG